MERDGGAGGCLRLADDFLGRICGRSHLLSVERKDEVVEQRVLGGQRESNPERSRFRVRVAELVVGGERDRIGGIPEQPSLALREVEVHLGPGALQRERDDFCLILGAQDPGGRPGLVVGAAPEGFYFLLEFFVELSGPGDQRGSRQHDPRERGSQENDDDGNKATNGHMSS